MELYGSFDLWEEYARTKILNISTEFNNAVDWDIERRNQAGFSGETWVWI